MSQQSTQRSVVACIIKLYVRYVVACRDMVRKAAYVERNLAQVEMLHGSWITESIPFCTTVERSVSDESDHHWGG